MREILGDQNFKIYLIYSFTFIVLGSIITGLGPLLPYLAFYENRS